jgi:ubiquinone/menaquinone biosynthesis C-methylase UbiE
VHGERIVKTTEELDEMLGILDEAARQSDDALRKVFGTYRMELDLELPEDPFSDEYRERMMELYHWLHGESYETDNEHTLFDPELGKRSPFPYITQSCPTVGQHLITLGSVIKLLELEPRSSVLELGAGWGNLTLALAQMGHQVTAIDVSSRFTDLLRARSDQVGANVNVINGVYADVAQMEERFDAVIFFESFHHSDNHLQLLRDLHKVLKPGGRLYLAAEPVLEGFPYPWGLRMDGESLWAIRRNGWLELGFQPSYFEEALRRTGWTFSARQWSDGPCSTVFSARSALAS